MDDVIYLTTMISILRFPDRTINDAVFASQWNLKMFWDELVCLL